MNKVQFAPSAGPIMQVVAASLPLFALILWFIWEAYTRRSKCTQLGSECAALVRLIDMAAVCLVVAQLWAVLAVYISFFIPRRHALLREYLDEGRTIIGDVYYKADPTCGGLRKNHLGYTTYPHPKSDVYPVYIRKQVRVLERYSREKIGIVVLADLPFSGQPKSDIEIDLAAAHKNSRKLFHLGILAWLWFLFAALSPIYILFIVDQMDTATETPSYGSSLMWIIYAVCVGVVIPFISIGLNGLRWYAHLEYVTKQGKVAEQGERLDGSGLGWFDSDESDDCEAVSDYHPPTPKSSESSDEVIEHHHRRSAVFKALKKPFIKKGKK